MLAGVTVQQQRTLSLPRRVLHAQLLPAAALQQHDPGHSVCRTGVVCKECVRVRECVRAGVGLVVRASGSANSGGSSATTATESRKHLRSGQQRTGGGGSSNGSGEGAMDNSPRPAAASQSLPHDAIPLTVKNGSLSCPVTGAVVDALHPGMRPNPLVSGRDGGMVLSLHAPEGPASFLDVTLGKVRLRSYTYDRA